MRNFYLFFYCTITLFIFSSCNSVNFQPVTQCISVEPIENGIELTNRQKGLVLIYDTAEFIGSKKVMDLFASDLEKVTGIKPSKLTHIVKDGQSLVIIGTIGKSKLIDSLINVGKIDKQLIENKWETSIIQVVKNPCKGVEKALIVAGSDKRGTIYGMLSLSRAMGVSPWYWWADVPVSKKEQLYIKPGVYSDGEPQVKYRGIFINDEAPALSGWVYENFGEFNSQFYGHVFELILRLKGNYLWPAMWGRAFNINDTLNPVLADELGIVMGTSHHEPMLRAQQEWKLYGKGRWDYSKNQAVLDSFWRQGIINMKNHESIITIGMRGDGDEPMSEESNIALLEKIVKNQRDIIAQETHKPASDQPQLWALYKEVQEYYEKGMRVPDDVTLLLCDDNWGNVRKLPNEEELKHPGGYGMYYHFDYVGGPRNYKWLNTNSIPRIWEQMHLTYEKGVDRIWIVNVGDIKPMELPMSFLLDYAWNPKNWTIEKTYNYTLDWAKEQFDTIQAKEISWLLDKYTWYNSRRKPELLDANTYSLYNYREFEKVAGQYQTLATEAEAISNTLQPEYSNAFYQLVLYPIDACANLNQLYYCQALNNLYHKQERTFTNQMAKKVSELFYEDTLLTWHYNHIMSHGKWNHQMDQTHIGYTYWQQPDSNVMPVTYTYVPVDSAKMGIWIEGDTGSWPKTNLHPKLPEFSRYGQGSFFFEIYNIGNKPFSAKIIPSANWIKLSTTNELEVTYQQRVEVSIDWRKLPENTCSGSIQIQGPSNQNVEIGLSIESMKQNELKGFIASNRFIGINAHDYQHSGHTKGFSWINLSRVGKISSGITAFPLLACDTNDLADNPYVEYEFTTMDTGKMEVTMWHCPTLDFKNQGGLRYAISIDKEVPRLVNIHKQATTLDWNRWVADNIIQTVTTFKIEKAGKHTLRYYLVDEGLVLQKITINQGGLKPSYLGPWESYRVE